MTACLATKCLAMYGHVMCVRVIVHEMMCGSHKRLNYTQMLAYDQIEKPCCIIKVQVGRK
jgi:hypothetical protein